MTAPIHIGVKEAKDIIGCGINMVYELVYSGKLPAARIGKRIRIRREDVERYVNTMIDQQTRARRGK